MPPEAHSVLGASAADRWMNCTPSAQLTAGMEDETTTFAAEEPQHMLFVNGRCERH